MQKVDFYSYEQQDEFIVNIFNLKRDGFFLDIGCAHPIIGNNTYTLDSVFGWKGFCFDLYNIIPGHWDLKSNQPVNYGWSDVRKAPLMIMDATTPDFTEFLRNNVPKDLVVDYVSLDIDIPGHNFSLMGLNRILDAGIKFKAVTLEHETYKWGNDISTNTRHKLEELGYVRLIENVRLWGGGLLPDEGVFSEDWWIHPQYFDEKLLKAKQSKVYFFDAVEGVRRVLGNNRYQGHRHCNQAFPKQHDTFMGHGDSLHHISRDPNWRPAFSSDLV